MDMRYFGTDVGWYAAHKRLRKSVKALFNSVYKAGFTGENGEDPRALREGYENSWKQLLLVQKRKADSALLQLEELSKENIKLRTQLAKLQRKE